MKWQFICISLVTQELTDVDSVESSFTHTSINSSEFDSSNGSATSDSVSHDSKMQPDSITDIIRETHGDDIADLVDRTSMGKESLKRVFKSKAVSIQVEVVDNPSSTFLFSAMSVCNRVSVLECQDARVSECYGGKV